MNTADTINDLRNKTLTFDLDWADNRRAAEQELHRHMADQTWNDLSLMAYALAIPHLDRPAQYNLRARIIQRVILDAWREQT